MTREHLFFIPFVFLFGVVVGGLVTSARLGRRTAETMGRPAPRVGALGLVLPLVSFVALFVVTHLLGAHGGPQAVEQSLGGRPLFDQHPSFTADDVYARIDAFGDAGRAAYARMTFTVDLVFPLVLFAFLVQLLRFVVERSPRGGRRPLLLLFPTAWLLSDLLENALIHRLLTSYPARHDVLAAALGSLTYLKFTLLVASVAMAAVLALPRPSGEKSPPGAFRA